MFSLHPVAGDEMGIFAFQFGWFNPGCFCLFFDEFLIGFRQAGQGNGDLFTGFGDFQSDVCFGGGNKRGLQRFPIIGGPGPGGSRQQSGGKNEREGLHRE